MQEPHAKAGTIRTQSISISIKIARSKMGSATCIIAHKYSLKESIKSRHLNLVLMDHLCRSKPPVSSLRKMKPSFASHPTAPLYHRMPQLFNVTLGILLILALLRRGYELIFFVRWTHQHSLALGIVLYFDPRRGK